MSADPLLQSPKELDRLRATFQDADISTHSKKWDGLWTESFTPWDRGGPSAALGDIIESRQDLFPATTDSATGRRRTALVPGCGRGYDVQFLAAFGYDTFGLDVSPIAVQEATETQKKMSDDEVFQPRKRDGVQVEKGKFTFLNGDFFSDDFLDTTQTKTFDLIFDYTFFCALPPDMRSKWADRMSQLLAPEGRLVCLEFPLSKDPSSGGPPWGLSPEIYGAHLSRPGEQVTYDTNSKPVEDDSKPNEKALKRLVRVKPERTHKSGYDLEGNVVDHIAVWGH
ncbi:thiol methyltransferase-like protein [Mariannaea sp. PMI_226]|nr:thiol methyltransferase-like protein [Mariannaea sp. PMI_226]